MMENRFRNEANMDVYKIRILFSRNASLVTFAIDRLPDLWYAETMYSVQDKLGK
jgi:hypothetical protein